MPRTLAEIRAAGEKARETADRLFDNKDPDAMGLKGQFLSVDIAYESAEVETLMYRNIRARSTDGSRRGI
jgi:hypothetical protein